MRFRAFALFAAGVALFSACDSGKDYDADKGDDDYDLAAMALDEGDLPTGFQQIPGTEFTGTEWAEVFGSEDPEAKQRQLEAQGWLRNYVTESVPPRFGKVLNVRSVSTLYTNEKAAEESTAKFACGLPIDTAEPIDEFIVPKIADQSNGFFVEEAIDEEGTTLMYTTVCFRTGRVVHVVQEAALPGLEDIGSGLRTARLMLAHVDNAFDGKVTPVAEDGEEDEEDEG
jgi:hypothetical protein